jgi:hypothetical protein
MRAFLAYEKGENYLPENTMGNLTLQLSLLVKPATSINTRTVKEKYSLALLLF